MLHGKPPVSARYMIDSDGSTGSFPGDFVDLEKWFRQPQRRVGPPDEHFAESDFLWALHGALKFCQESHLRSISDSGC
jgi:hypothetical protein